MLSSEQVEYRKALRHSGVLQDFLGFGVKNCDSFLTACGLFMTRKRVQHTLDCASIEDFNPY